MKGFHYIHISYNNKRPSRMPHSTTSQVITQLALINTMSLKTLFHTCLILGQHHNTCLNDSIIHPQPNPHDLQCICHNQAQNGNV